MADNIHIKLPDGSDKEMPKGSTALEASEAAMASCDSEQRHRQKRYVLFFQ
jgi:hypothetical protein